MSTGQGSGFQPYIFLFGVFMATLFVIATPIGNLEDMTFRALEALRHLDALACEDTRHTSHLLTHFQIERPGIVFSYHEHNEDRAAARVVSLLNDGMTVGLCSNAGYPGISDPGFVVVSKAIEAGHEICPVPGASAVPLALIMSGLPTSSFTFRGFPPRKPGRRNSFLLEDSQAVHTLIYYESPFRVGKFLGEALAVLGDRQAAVCLELTKKFERVDRGFLSELAELYATAKPRGEVTIVIAGNHPKYRREQTTGTMDDGDDG